MTTPEKATEERIRELIATPNGVLFTITGDFEVYATDFFRRKLSHSVSFYKEDINIEPDGVSITPEGLRKRDIVISHNPIVYEAIKKIEVFNMSGGELLTVNFNSRTAAGGKRKTKRTKRTKRKTRRTNLYK
jgi:hypothetical protein